MRRNGSGVTAATTPNLAVVVHFFATTQGTSSVVVDDTDLAATLLIEKLERNRLALGAPEAEISNLKLCGISS